MSKWKKGVITKSITSFKGDRIEKGETVSYKRVKTNPDDDGFCSTFFEWHYKTDSAFIRTSELIIEGIGHKTEPSVIG